MDVEGIQKQLGEWPLPEAGTPGTRDPDGDARHVADWRLVLLAKGGPWRERAEQLGSRAELFAEAVQGSGDA